MLSKEHMEGGGGGSGSRGRRGGRKTRIGIYKIN